jgi:uncharacterized protein YndB with AHSA1/START domain
MNDRGTIEGDTVRFERLLPGPVERVWSYLTERDRLATWLTDDGAVPPKVGESFVLRMKGGSDEEMPEREGYEAATYGKVLAYDPPQHLEYVWGVRGPDGKMLNSTVSFDLEPRGDKVALTLTHHGVMKGFESRTLAGWHTLLEGLQAALKGTPPPDFMARFREVEPQYASSL